MDRIKKVEIELLKAQLKGVADRIFKLGQQLKQCAGQNKEVMYELAYLGKRGEEINTEMEKALKDG